MKNYFLQITLQSPLTSSAGEGRAGLVDRDIAFDNLGLPILPGRRIKGLWREAYRDITDAWTLCNPSQGTLLSTSVDQIFGKPGQGYDAGDAYLHIGNAKLQKASFLKPWLEYFQHHKIPQIRPDDVIRHFTTVRVQTAIDRQTGVAREDTLRLTRTLRPNLVFHAPVQFEKLLNTPSGALLNALALGAAALQYMGIARTRGLGKVRCYLIAYDASGQEYNLTEQVLHQNSLAPITLTSSAQTPKRQMITVPSLNRVTPTHVLRYQITLKAPVIIPVADGDPNTVVTRQDIPGGHILGAAAWHYLRQTGHGPGDKEFRHAFLDGGLRFLTAYPETVDTKQRMLPIPHSIRQFKDNESLVNLADPLSNADAKRPKKRINRRYARISQGLLETQDVGTERNYHHARVAKDRRVGRALGAEITDGGAFFQYEAIQPGQTFQGAVLGSVQDLQNLQTWLQGVNSIRVGRSRSAQYGEADFKWVNPPQALNNLVEWDGFLGQTTFAVPNLGDCLIITNLSPLLTPNDNGHPEARFPLCELAKRLNLDANDLKLSCSYTRTELVGGYNTYLRLPRQQWPAIAAGSVFVFSIPRPSNEKDRCSREERLLQMEREGLGLFKGEGYGRIVVNRLKLTNVKETQLDAPDGQGISPVPNNGSKIPEEVQLLLGDIVRERCIAEMQQCASNLTTVAGLILNMPSNSLLGRLRLFLQQDEPARSLDNLRKPAKEGLMNCQISQGPGMPWMPRRTTLYALFKKAWTEPESLTQKLIEIHVKKLVEQRIEDKYPNTRQTLIDKLVQDKSEAMCDLFLNHLLTALYRKPRT